MVLVPVREMPRLFDECRGKLPRESCIVNRLHRNIVEDLQINSSHGTCGIKFGQETQLTFHCHRIIVRMDSQVHMRSNIPCFQRRQAFRQDTE